jgi:hypothetical protein
MDTPDIGKHVRDLIGGLMLEIATHKATAEQREALIEKLAAEVAALTKVPDAGRTEP